MKKIRNRIKLMVACATFSIACIGTGVLNLSSATALAENSSEFYVAGAAVKYVHDVTTIEDQDGLRFAVVVDNDVFDSWLNATQTDFADGISVGALVIPKDLAIGETLTHETEFNQVEGQAGIVDRKFDFEDFSDSIYEEYSNCKIAYVYLYDIPVNAYNRDYMVSAYCNVNGETAYTNTVARSIAYVADCAIEAGDENAEKLSGYIKEYGVHFYTDGEEQTNAQQSVRYGGKIDTTKLPTQSGGKYKWYADANFETEFDFNQKITGTTNVYGKSQTFAELTGGVFSYMDSDYTVSENGENLTLTQTLMNSSKKLGLAKFDVDGTGDYSVSAKITLSTAAVEDWITNESNTRVGFAFYGEGEGANSYIYSYRAGNFVFIRNTNGANELYSDTTDEGRKSWWDQRKDYGIKAGDTQFTMEIKKEGTSISVYVNGKLLESLTVEEGANLTPALFSYTFENVDNKVTVTYSDIVVNTCLATCEDCGLCSDVDCAQENHAEKCISVLGNFGEHANSYKAVKDAEGNWIVSQGLQVSSNHEGVAEMSIANNDNFSISTSIKLKNSINIAKDGNWKDGGNERIGFAFINENGAAYRFVMRTMWCSVTTYGKTTNLYEDKNGTSVYLYGKTNSTPYTPYVKLQNTSNMNEVYSVTLTMSKIDNTLFFYVNGELIATQTVEEGFTGVPALLGYSYYAQTNQVLTYSTITVSEPVAPEYDVTFLVDGAQKATTKVTHGETIDSVVIPTTEDRGTYEWYADAEYSTPFDFNQAITGVTTVYGKYVAPAEHTVTIYVNGELNTTLQVADGDKIEYTQLPTMGSGSLIWYADADFTTEFDFEQEITGEISVYGKYESVSELTGGVFSSMDSDYTISGNGAEMTLTQTLANSANRLGVAKFNIQAGVDFYISADLKLTRYIHVASQGWVTENDRYGFALVNENGENYRMQMRSALTAVLTYGKDTVLYGDNGASSKYLLGSTNGTTNSIYQAGCIKLKNTSNMNSVSTVKIAVSKIGNELVFYVNGEMVAKQQVESDFNGVPALFAYSFEKNPAQVITYSNIVVKTGDEATYSDKTSDFSYDTNGNLTHTLKKNADGFAKFNVDGTKDYTVSFTADFSKAIAYDNGQSAGGTDGHNNRIGVTFYGGENGTSYNFALSMVWRNAVRIINESGKNLYNDTDYTLSDGSKARTSFYSVRDKFAKMGDTKVDITMKKVGNTISVYLNDYKLETLTVAAGANLIPAILSYDLQDSTNPMTVTYSNIVIDACADICGICGHCSDVDCELHTAKCINSVGMFTSHTSDYQATKDANGNWAVSHTLASGTEKKGLAYFDVGGNNDYSISVDIKLSGNPATAAQGETLGADMRVGFVLINPETGENYRFLFRGTKCALIFYDKSNQLYELRSGSAFEESAGAVTYVYGKTNSTPSQPMLVLQNTGAINNSANIKLKLKKVGNSVSIYLNGEFWMTTEVDENFAGVPAFLGYELDGKGGRTHTYSNIVITTGADAVNA